MCPIINVRWTDVCRRRQLPVTKHTICLQWSCQHLSIFFRKSTLSKVSVWTVLRPTWAFIREVQLQCDCTMNTGLWKLITDRNVRNAATEKDILWTDRSVPWCGLHTQRAAVCKAWQISYGSTGSQQPERDSRKKAKKRQTLSVSVKGLLLSFLWVVGRSAVIPGRAPLDCIWLKCCSVWPPPPPSASARSPVCSSQAIWAFLQAEQTHWTLRTLETSVDLPGPPSCVASITRAILKHLHLWVLG